MLTPINVAIFRAVQSRAFPPRGVVFAALTVTIGAILVVTRGNLAALASGGSMVGNLLVLISSICWTFYTIKAQSMVGYSAVRLTMLTCSFGAPVGLALAAVLTAAGVAHPPAPADLLRIWPQILYLFVAVSAVSIITWNIAVRAVGAQTATLVSTFTPVIPFAWAWWNGQSFTPAGNRRRADDYRGDLAITSTSSARRWRLRRRLSRRLTHSTRKRERGRRNEAANVANTSSCSRMTPV